MSLRTLGGDLGYCRVGRPRLGCQMAAYHLGQSLINSSQSGTPKWSLLTTSHYLKGTPPDGFLLPLRINQHSNTFECIYTHAQWHTHAHTCTHAQKHNLYFHHTNSNKFLHWSMRAGLTYWSHVTWRWKKLFLAVAVAHHNGLKKLALIMN